MNKKHVVLILTLAIAFGSVYTLLGQVNEQGQKSTTESVVRELYTLVSFAPNSTPDWEDVKSLFIDEDNTLMGAFKNLFKIDFSKRNIFILTFIV